MVSVLQSVEGRKGHFAWVGTCPALLPAGALLGGVRLGLASTVLPVGPVVVLAWLGIALGSCGRGVGRLVTVAALGLVLGSAAGAPAWTPVPDRSVAAVAVVAGHWRWFGDAWSAPVRIVRVRQGTRLRTRELEGTLRLPGREEPPALGSRLRVRGHLRRAPALGNDPPLPPGPWRLTAKSRLLVERVGDGGPVGGWASALRRRVETGLASAFAGAAGSSEEEEGDGGPSRDGGRDLGRGLVRALVLGDASDVPLAVRQGLRRMGLAHVLAVSGLHVGLVAGAALALGGRMPRRLRLATALAAVGVYLFVVGPRPSLLRASVMACLAVAALLAERPPQAANALAVAAAGIVLMQPEAVLDVGFRLTVGATAGIVLLGPALARRWCGGPPAGAAGGDRSGPGGWRAGSRRTLATSVAAQLGVLPWALPVFCLFTPWAPAANLVAVPWTAFALAACLAWAGLACWAPGLAAATVEGVELMAAPFAWPSAIPPSPWIALPVATGFGGAAAVALGFGVVAWRPRWLGRMGRGWVGVSLVAFGAVVGAAAPVGEGADGVEAVMIDVGQGDAILLRDGDRAVLVDGGGWRHGDLGGRVLLPVLVRRGLRRIDSVVVTHPDRDHCGGLVDVAGYLAVGEVVSGPGIGASACGRALDALPGVERREVAAGAAWSVGRWRLRVLHPVRSGDAGADRPVRRGSDNDGSVVIAAEAFGLRLLLTGDLERGGERRLLRRFGDAVRADVLKVGHHGSRSSTGPGFLRRVDPRLALISAGVRNPYGHPAEEILERLSGAGVHAFRTDRDGMVVVRVRPDGTLTVRLPAAPKWGE